MLIKIETRDRDFRGVQDLLKVRIPNWDADFMKDRKMPAYFKQAAEAACRLLEFAVYMVGGGPSEGPALLLTVSGCPPDQARKMFDILSKELGSMEVLWDPVCRLQATVTGEAPLKGRGRRH
jgi:hypothetical protein